MNTCDIELINTCFHYFAIAVGRGLASSLLDRLSAHPACRELATGLAGHSPPAFSPTFASNPPLDPTPEELATLAKLEELAPDYAPDFGPKPGGFCGVAGELVFCVYCGDEKLPLFKNAKNIFSYYYGVAFDAGLCRGPFSTGDVRHLTLDAGNTSIDSFGVGKNRPPQWKHLNSPAACAYRVLLQGGRQGYVSALGKNKDALQRASCLALAALRVILGNLVVTQQTPEVNRVVEKFRDLLDQPSPASQEYAASSVSGVGTSGTAYMPKYLWHIEAEQFLEKTVIEWGDVKWIPVMCLRWTHSGIDSRMQFKSGSSIWHDLVMPLWRWGWTWFNAIEAMDVVLDEYGDLWSLSNRRLAAFRMLQALNAETVWVRCRVLPPGSYKFFSAKTTRNGGMGIAPNPPNHA